ncbi:hypothetical protein DWY84_01460 [Clostridium sp. AF27-2AA]|nr:hypothetical protein DWY84_01460 [Clostridium sp. AF27-2AA]
MIFFKNSPEYSNINIVEKTWSGVDIPFTKTSGNANIVTLKQSVCGKVVQLYISLTATGTTNEGDNIIVGQFTNTIKRPISIINTAAYQTSDIYIYLIDNTGKLVIRASKGGFVNGTINFGICYLSQ